MTHHPSHPGDLSPELLARMAAASPTAQAAAAPHPGLASAAPRAASAELPPPTRVVRFTYRTPDGEEHQHTLQLRLLTFQERALVAQNVALNLGGQSWDSVPLDDALHIRAACWCETMFTNQPAWFRRACLDDRLLAQSLYEQGEELRSAYFRGEFSSGGGDAGTPRLVFHSTQPTSGTL